MFPTKPTGKDSNESVSYTYIGFWSALFYVRQVILPKLLPIVVVILLVLEVAGGPLTSLLPFTARLANKKEAIEKILWAVAALLAFHHYRSQRKIRRLTLVLTSTMVVLETQSMDFGRKTRIGEQAKRRVVSDILDAFVFALEREYPDQNFAASVMSRESENEPFRMFAQDPRMIFESSVELHHLESAAGHAASSPAGTLIYVPRANRLHGASIGTFGRAGDESIFRKAKIVPNAFQSCPEDGGKLGCLLCIAIPLRDGPRLRTAVLSISHKKPGQMGDLEFQTIKVAASLVGLAMLG